MVASHAHLPGFWVTGSMCFLTAERYSAWMHSCCVGGLTRKLRPLAMQLVDTAIPAQMPPESKMFLCFSDMSPGWERETSNLRSPLGRDGVGAGHRDSRR